MKRVNEKRKELEEFCSKREICDCCPIEIKINGCNDCILEVATDEEIKDLYEKYMKYKGDVMKEKENRVDTAEQDNLEQSNAAEKSYDKILDKKRDKLIKLCESYGDFCDKCPLKDSDIGICNFREENDNLIEQYYKVAFPNEFIITLTKTQAENLLEFIDIYFINSIRDDEEVDNMDYLCDMCDVYKKLKDILENNKQIEGNSDNG